MMALREVLDVKVHGIGIPLYHCVQEAGSSVDHWE
jgi:hypothetical protein